MPDPFQKMIANDNAVRMTLVFTDNTVGLNFETAGSSLRGD